MEDFTPCWGVAVSVFHDKDAFGGEPVEAAV